MDYDLDALLSDPASLALVPGFALLFLRHPRACRRCSSTGATCRAPSAPSLALFSAAALPLLVAITQIGLDTGTMRTEVAVSLVGAGMLSVLVYPLLALIAPPPRGRGAGAPGRGPRLALQQLLEPAQRLRRASRAAGRRREQAARALPSAPPGSANSFS